MCTLLSLHLFAARYDDQMSMCRKTWPNKQTYSCKKMVGNVFYFQSLICFEV